MFKNTTMNQFQNRHETSVKAHKHNYEPNTKTQIKHSYIEFSPTDDPVSG